MLWVIPKGLRPEENQIYKKLFEVVEHRKKKNQGPPHIVVITDIAKDVDDLVAMMLLKELHRLGLIVLEGFVANLKPENTRAALARGALNSLNLQNVPVAVGTDGTSNHYEVHDYEFNKCNFFPSGDDLKNIPQGSALLHRLCTKAKQEKRKLTFLLISSLRDIAEFASAAPDLMRDVTERIVFQGGYKVTETFATDIPVQLCIDMENSGHALGPYTRYAQTQMDLAFYKTACEPNPKDRFQPFMDQKWYLERKTSWCTTPHAPNERLPVGEEVVPYLTKLVAYDALAALGASGDDILDHLGISLPINGKKPLHQIIGHFGKPAVLNSRGEVKQKAIPDNPDINTRAMSQAIQALVLGSLLECMQNRN
ncbi:hypothetical protein G7Y89_g12823 [Cudoniella acicularis]|uniref:Inosine/uridine-preferring nucleoside hydrolase domain-containing protein n=1 Tax=Cudoniella acicularis TaxID=354080 RepID=A0A8H4RAS8_9HELO|nr:hypothetical protein G7Y89_g12823 [Cudoniella acicularis]